MAQPAQTPTAETVSRPLSHHAIVPDDPAPLVFYMSCLKSSSPSLAARQSHWASILGTSKLNLWMKFPKSILIAVTLGDLGDSKLMMMCGKHFFKLPGRAFTLKVSLPFRSHWVFMNFLPMVQVKLKWGQCISLYLDDLLKCLSQWAVGPMASKLHRALYKGKVSEAAVSFHQGLSGGTWSHCAQPPPWRKWLPVCASHFQSAVFHTG